MTVPRYGEKQHRHGGRPTTSFQISRYHAVVASVESRNFVLSRGCHVGTKLHRYSYGVTQRHTHAIARPLPPLARATRPTEISSSGRPQPFRFRRDSVAPMAARSSQAVPTRCGLYLAATGGVFPTTCRRLVLSRRSYRGRFLFHSPTFSARPDRAAPRRRAHCRCSRCVAAGGCS